jgi:ubiquitin-like 1-activating enzyme E1 A
MSKAKVLYVHLTGASTEVLKNLVLAGIRATIYDPRPYPDAIVDAPSFFSPSSNKKLKYASVAHAFCSGIQELNPLLGDCEIIEDLETLDYAQFSTVVASRISIPLATKISQAITATGGTFYMVDSFGMHGASVFDLGPNRTYRPEVGKELLDVKELKNHVSLKDVFSVPLEQATNRFHKKPPPTWVLYRCLLEHAEKNNKGWELQEDFDSKVRSWLKETSPSLTFEDGCATIGEVAPVCAVLGGIVGNEVIKSLSGKGEPANNTILFDGISCKAWTFLVQPKK